MEGELLSDAPAVPDGWDGEYVFQADMYAIGWRRVMPRRTERVRVADVLGAIRCDDGSPWVVDSNDVGFGGIEAVIVGRGLYDPIGNRQPGWIRIRTARRLPMKLLRAPRRHFAHGRSGIRASSELE